ncbi:hypothetical protein WH47_00959 [Habropoda laboriosa]|uniref:Uncharacterized protein n=1 Tax=Habropoda laboriosa TaxID=597456 RepID=A0A0L7QJY5_9HYME|nr:hypothetical protein WH47_00959 [Habropoda laboriosa]
MKQNYDDSSSSSSVDTAAYILANMNATNKAETMAIVEGANISVSSHATPLVTDKICAKECEHIALDNNDNNYQQCFSTSEISKCVLQQNNTDEHKNITQIQKNLDTTVANKNTLSETLNVNDELVHNNKFRDSKVLDETFTHIIGDGKDRNSYIKYDSLSVQLSQTNQNYFARENSIVQDSATQTRHRKKLYNGRDSPIDLIDMKRTNKNIVLEPQQNLHPALDFESKLKTHKMRKMRKRKVFHTFNKNSMNNSQLNSSRYNKRLQRTSIQIFDETSITANNDKKSDDAYSIILNRSQNLIECNTKECMNMFLSTNRSTNTENKLNKSTNYLEKCNANKYEKLNVITQFTHLKPVVYLTRLSEVDIQKHKNLNTAVTNSYNLNDNNYKHRNQHSIFKNLKDLNPQKLNVQKPEKQDKMVKRLKNLNPVIRLKRLSELEIQKYKKSAIITINLGNLNPTVQLKKLSHFEIQKYRNVNDKKALNKDDLLSKTTLLQNDDVNICQLPQINAADYSNSEMLNDCTSEIKETLNNNVFNNKGGLMESKVCQNIMTYTCPNIFQNDERNKKTNRNQLKLYIAKRNPTYKKQCRIRNMKFKKIRSIKSPSTTHLKNSNLRKNLFFKKNVYINNSKKLHMLLLSEDEDENDEFVKLIYYSEESKLRNCYNMLNQSSNCLVNKTDSCEYNTSNSIIKSVSSQTFLKNQEENFSLVKSKSFKYLKNDSNSRILSHVNKENLNCKGLITTQSCNLSVKEDHSIELSETQTLLKDQTKLSPKVDIIKNKNKLSLSNLCFETNVFDSDLDSFSF